MTVRRAINSLAGALTLLLAAPVAGVAVGQAPASGAEGPEATFFVVDLPASGVGEERVVKKGKSLWSQPLHAERAARLEAELPDVRLAFGGRTTIPAGTRLFSLYTGGTQAFCSPRERFRVYPGFICFFDADKDGRFEASQVASSTGKVTGFVGVYTDQTIGELGLEKQPAPLATPLPYTEIPYREGPHAAVRFWWRSSYSQSGGGKKPTIVQIWTNFDVPDMPGGRSVGPTFTVELDAQNTGRLVYGGAIFSILGFLPDGSLRYRVDAPMPQTRMRPPMTPTPQYIMIYI